MFPYPQPTNPQESAEFVQVLASPAVGLALSKSVKKELARRLVGKTAEDVSYATLIPQVAPCLHEMYMSDKVCCLNTNLHCRRRRLKPHAIHGTPSPQHAFAETWCKLYDFDSQNQLFYDKLTGRVQVAEPGGFKDTQEGARLPAGDMVAAALNQYFQQLRRDQGGKIFADVFAMHLQSETLGLDLRDTEAAAICADVDVDEVGLESPRFHVFNSH